MSSAARGPCDITARAKLNLALRVLAREDSGYHQIETLFCALELADELSIELTEGGIELDATADASSGAGDLGPVDANLAVRAACAFFAAFGATTGARIRLTKRIPVGAGLGGGSSDAASVLIALNRLHENPFSHEQLALMGGRLGSDVPFFITRAALALAWGRGDRLLPLHPLPSVPVVLAVPPERIPTADAYSAFARGRASGDAVGAAILKVPGSWSDVAAHASNDFERSAFAQYPRLAAVRALLEARGALVARMTGSGSVVFGVFADTAAAERAAGDMGQEQPDVTILLTRTAESTRPD